MSLFLASQYSTLVLTPPVSFLFPGRTLSAWQLLPGRGKHHIPPNSTCGPLLVSAPQLPVCPSEDPKGGSVAGHFLLAQFLPVAVPEFTGSTGAVASQEEEVSNGILIQWPACPSRWGGRSFGVSVVFASNSGKWNHGQPAFKWKDFFFFFFFFSGFFSCLRIWKMKIIHCDCTFKNMQTGSNQGG